MTTTAPLPCRRVWVALSLLLLATRTPSVRAQSVDPVPEPRPDLARAPLVPALPVTTPTTVSGPRSTNRIRLFRIQPAFISDFPGVDSDEAPLGESESGPDFVNFTFGNDNPFFDFRQRGDPGGVGFTRVNTQVQLFGSETTTFALGVQAVTPAGLEYDGLPDRMGATVVCPALSLYYALDESLAVQAFIAKNVPIQNGSAQSVRREVQCGVGVQRPLSTEESDPLRHLYLSVGALGLLRGDTPTRTPVMVEVLPGLQYRLGENWWISGALSMPVVAPRGDGSQFWQVTCSWQF